MKLESLIALILVLLTAGMMGVFALPRFARRAPALRSIPAIRKLRRAIGLAVEQGMRLHISLGKSSITGPDNGSALAALSTLEQIARTSSLSDRPPVATSGDGTLAILSQDTLRAGYRLSHALDQYDPDRGRMTGPTPMSYIAGALPITSSEQVSTHMLLGNFGPEVGLITEAAEQQGAFTLAASDALPAQAVLYATAEEPLIGEELFALPAYLQAGGLHQSSLRAQDILRWVISGGLVLGAILKLVGVL